MPKINRPNSDKDVLREMRKYCQDKGYTFSNTQLNFMAEDCYLFFESRGWKGIKYWPAVAMRWVLTNLDKQIKKKTDYSPRHSGGKTVREKILEGRKDE